MKKIKTILILIFLPLGIYSQDLIPFQSNGLWGYKDTLENTVIEPQYQYARKFQDKYAVIAQEDFLGAIDKQNNQIIYPEYEFIRYIGNERFLFGYRAKYFGEYNLGIITSKNDILIQPEYYNINLKNGYFIVNKQSYKITNSDGIYDTRKISNRYGVMDSLGNVIFEPIYSRIKFLRNGYVITRKELNGNYALFDTKFNQLTEHKYMVIGDYYDGLSKVRNEDCFGYINLEGLEEIECKYELNYIFIDSLAIVRNNGKAGLINRKDELIIKCKYQGLGIPFKNQITAFDSLKWGILNLDGDTLLPFLYEKRISEFKGITAFLKDNKWKIWDYEKSKLLPSKYDEIKLIEGDESTVLGFGRTKQKKYSQSIAFARIGEKWGVINHRGNILIPIEFDRKDLYEKMKTL
jgi:hypothetical protein